MNIIPNFAENDEQLHRPVHRIRQIKLMPRPVVYQLDRELDDEVKIQNIKKSFQSTSATKDENKQTEEEDADDVQTNIIKLKDHIFPVGTIYQPKADLFDTIYKHPIRKNIFENSAVYIYDTTKEPQTTMDQLYPGFFANRKIRNGYKRYRQGCRIGWWTSYLLSPF